MFTISAKKTATETKVEGALTNWNPNLFQNSGQRYHSPPETNWTPDYSSQSTERIRTAMEVIDDLENSRSASLNFLFRLSAFEFVVLLLDKYLSQPRIMFPYSCVSSKYDPSKA